VAHTLLTILLKKSGIFVVSTSAYRVIITYKGFTTVVAIMAEMIEFAIMAYFQ